MRRNCLHRAASWIATPPYLCVTFLTLVVWQPLIASARLGGRRTFDAVVAAGNFLLIKELLITGTRVKISGNEHLPAEGPVIVISNHQSVFDIPLLIWIFRRYGARFVAKRELGRWIPSVSYVLRNGGSALIDRSSAKQSIPAIRAMGERAVAEKLAACIFPEGTRARDGAKKPFRPAGARALLEAAPGAPVVPVVIRGTWRVVQHGFLPVPFGSDVTCRVLPAITRERDPDAVLAEAERSIAAVLDS